MCMQSCVAACPGSGVCLVVVLSLFEAELVLVPANVEETVRHVLWRQEDDEELQKAFQGDLAECNAI